MNSSKKNLIRFCVFSTSLAAASLLSIKNRYSDQNFTGLEAQRLLETMPVLVEKCIEKSRGTNEFLSIEATQDMARGLGYMGRLEENDWIGLHYDPIANRQSAILRITKTTKNLSTFKWKRDYNVGEDNIVTLSSRFAVFNTRSRLNLLKDNFLRSRAVPSRLPFDVAVIVLGLPSYLYPKVSSPLT